MTEFLCGAVAFSDESVCAREGGESRLSARLLRSGTGEKDWKGDTAGESSQAAARNTDTSMLRTNTNSSYLEQLRRQIGFLAMDQDRDGVLNYEELYRALSSTGPAFYR
eukprot:GHVU01221048.1.p4 GENE.GHVU01221048.1~~GHVU01221048.1.p4  ORF type:complete len:109 (+),score=21.97 GHVU01221048.1:1200-1526(+)